MHTTKNESEELLNKLSALHTTMLGIERIKKNLGLQEDDVVDWCKRKILSKEAHIERRGKNWYVSVDKIIFTINAYSYTIITAHRQS